MAPALLTALCLSAAAAPAGPSDAELSPERIVFHTAAGDLVFALYPRAAPETAKQFLALARSGAYDGTAIVRVHPGFIVQVGNVESRKEPLSTEQRALARPLPLEASSLHHLRGVLSLTHPEGEPDRGESSFCVMLGPAPHLDGKYTVFGELVAGEPVLSELLDVPRTAQLVPTVRVGIDRVDVYDSEEALDDAYVVPAHPVAGLPKAAAEPPRQDPVVIAGLVAMALLAAAGGLLRRQLPSQAAGAMSLIVLLLCTFLLLALLLPEGQHRPWLATTLFFGMVLVFKALGRFEQAA